MWSLVNVLILAWADLSGLKVIALLLSRLGFWDSLTLDFGLSP